jgi:hypothetical protein
MQAKSIHEYFYFGTCVRYLQDASQGQKIHGDGYIVQNIISVFNSLDELDLQVTRRAADDLEELKGQLEATDEGAVLNSDQATKLRNTVKDLRLTLQAEVLGFEAYVVTPKRIDIRKLLGEVENLFAPGVFSLLPEVAIHDFTEGAKCIAFERSTAAAFHILRATEAVLRYYYCRQVKRNRCQMMWGNIIQDLRKRRKTKEKIALLNNLDNIRLSFRNPTQHPEKIYDIQEAQDLWSLCVDVVNRMIQDLDHSVTRQSS